MVKRARLGQTALSAARWPPPVALLHPAARPILHPAARSNIGSCSLTTVKPGDMILPARQRVRPEVRRQGASIGSSLRLEHCKTRHFCRRIHVALRPIHVALRPIHARQRQKWRMHATEMLHFDVRVAHSWHTQATPCVTLGCRSGVPSANLRSIVITMP